MQRDADRPVADDLVAGQIELGKVVARLRQHVGHVGKGDRFGVRHRAYGRVNRQPGGTGDDLIVNVQTAIVGQIDQVKVGRAPFHRLFQLGGVNAKLVHHLHLDRNGVRHIAAFQHQVAGVDTQRIHYRGIIGEVNDDRLVGDEHGRGGQLGQPGDSIAATGRHSIATQRPIAGEAKVIKDAPKRIGGQRGWIRWITGRISTDPGAVLTGVLINRGRVVVIPGKTGAIDRTDQNVIGAIEQNRRIQIIDIPSGQIVVQHGDVVGCQEIGAGSRIRISVGILPDD